MFRLSTLLAASALLLAISRPPTAGAQTVIGVSLPLTGPAATYGVDLRNALTYANDRFGNGAFTLQLEDDRCDPNEAVRIAHKLVDVDHVRFVTGLPCSGTVLAAAPIYGAAGVLVVTSMAGSPKIADAGSNVFRTRPSDAHASGKLFEAVSREFPSVGVIAEQTDYALGMYRAFANRQSESTLSIVEEEFQPGTTDLRPILMKLKARGVRALLILPQTEQSLLIAVRQVHDLQWKVPIFSSWLAESPSFLKAAGPLGDGIRFATVRAADQSASPALRSLFADYQKSYGPLESVSAGFECGVDSFLALRAAANEPQRAREVLLTGRFPDAPAPFSFDDHGEIVGLTFVMARIIGDKVTYDDPTGK